MRLKKILFFFDVSDATLGIFSTIMPVVAILVLLFLLSRVVTDIKQPYSMYAFVLASLATLCFHALPILTSSAVKFTEQQVLITFCGMLVTIVITPIEIILKGMDSSYMFNAILGFVITANTYLYLLSHIGRV